MLVAREDVNNDESWRELGQFLAKEEVSQGEMSGRS